MVKQQLVKSSGSWGRLRRAESTQEEEPALISHPLDHGDQVLAQMDMPRNWDWP